MTPSQIEQARTLLYDRNALSHQLRLLESAEVATIRTAELEWQAKDADMEALKEVVRGRLEGKRTAIEAILRDLGVTEWDEAIKEQTR